MQSKRQFDIIAACIMFVAALVFLVTFLLDNDADPSTQDSVDTVAKFQIIRSAMVSYFSRNQQWPAQDAWAEQIAPYIETEWDVLIDGWGTPIKYIVVKKKDGTERYLHSFGYNRRDDHGWGDDIFKPVELVKTFDKQLQPEN